MSIAVPADDQYDVFISYRRSDRPWVKVPLLQQLEAKGLRVCIDYRDFVPGKAAIQNMEDAVVNSWKTLLILTPGYLESNWTEFVNVMLQTLDPVNRQLRLIPLVKERCELPLRIGMLTYLNFAEPEDEALEWRRLLTALGKPPELETVSPEVPPRWFLAHPYLMPPHFTGREAERRMLRDWLNRDEKHPLLVLRALGGFGKSALT